MARHLPLTVLALAIAGCAQPIRPATAVVADRGGDASTAAVATAVSTGSLDTDTALAGAARTTRSGPLDTPAPVAAIDTPPPQADSALVVAAEALLEVPSWDIDVQSYLTHDRVEYYIRRYTGDARQRVVEWMQRGRRYEPMIRSTFREAGIPEDMYFLGLVESGYDVHAYSRAAAVGMWQFMTATGKGVGLRIDWWVDERRDPVRSTQAAAKFLSALRDQFGSLYLAAAAYNGGPGRISRGLTQYSSRMGDAEGDDLFFALAETRALRSETSNYVPQLIAAAAIGKAPHAYGIKLEDVTPFAYDSAKVPSATPVSAVALAAGVELEAVRDLNPHLLRGVTPLDDSSWVRVPVGSGRYFEVGFAALDDSIRVPWTKVKAKKGATVPGMAKAAGLTATQLRWYNPRLKASKIPTGTVVLVPKRDVVRAAFNVPDPAVERYGTSARGMHVVRKGETLSHIARRNGTTVARLMQLNRLKRSVIYAGQSIRVR